LGSESNEAYALKLLLLDQHCDPGEINTVFDQKAADAVASFQKQNGLEPTGETNQATWEKITTRVGYSADFGNSNAVKAVQYLLLNKYAFSSLYVTGDFDLDTKAAVLLFQADFDVGTNGTDGVDGIVGTKTWSYLIQDSKKAQEYGWAMLVEFNRDRGVPGRLYVYDAFGKKMMDMPCLGQSMTANGNWREELGNTPLGTFRGYVSQKQRDPLSYGPYNCIGLNEADVKAVTHDRSGILIHSGVNPYRAKRDYSLPDQYKNKRAQTIEGLDQTHGCIRISEGDHARLYNSLDGLGMGVVSIGESLDE
jgi:peptidoglycan hydrolase-like protein with peptidoglycan-binding domain